MQRWCHHEGDGQADPVRSKLHCRYCGEWVTIDDVEASRPSDPHVVLPGCRCPKCEAGRAKQKDRIL
jgi:hypothetical protein